MGCSVREVEALSVASEAHVECSQAEGRRCTVGGRRVGMNPGQSEQVPPVAAAAGPPPPTSSSRLSTLTAWALPQGRLSARGLGPPLPPGHPGGHLGVVPGPAHWVLGAVPVPTGLAASQPAVRQHGEPAPVGTTQATGSLAPVWGRESSSHHARPAGPAAAGAAPPWDRPGWACVWEALTESSGTEVCLWSVWAAGHHRFLELGGDGASGPHLPSGAAAPVFGHSFCDRHHGACVFLPGLEAGKAESSWPSPWLS